MIASSAYRRLSGPPRVERRGRPPKYPWNSWVAARRPIHLFKNVDYFVDSKNFATTLRAAFAARGVRVRAVVSQDGDSVFVEDRA